MFREEKHRKITKYIYMCKEVHRPYEFLVQGVKKVQSRALDCSVQLETMKKY